MQTKFTVVFVLLVVVAKFIELGSTKGTINLNEADVTEIFSTSDTNGDGFISVDELKKATARYDIELTDQKLAEIYSQSDIDGDGKLDYQEVVAALKKMNLLASAE